MYSQDSFFDLSAIGQVGLAALSLTLFVLTVTLAHLLLRRRPVWLRLLGAAAIFWAFVWLSPQIYYMYYRVLIPDLPLQWVIKVPPVGAQRLFELLTFQWRANLSAHSQGVLGWCVLLAPFLRWPRATPAPRDTL
ncbi:hypothetical protein [uncultured Tateyamaria sp.]|uniref:hypothetical protein n=1 Tax=uncultured Tateyamaria sp. TaxID=455651 RepID=UPI002613DB51|nr:hypothetical protein [uncultured Tateyamaria sp.]